MRRLRRTITLSILIAVTACAPYWQIAPQPRTIQGILAVAPGETWARAWVTPFDGWEFLFPAPVERWTIDGERLDLLTFFVGVPDGEPIVRIPGVRKENLPVFRSVMSPPEIMELFEAAFGKASGTAVLEGRNLRAAPFGEGEGFRFEISLTLPDDR